MTDAYNTTVTGSTMTFDVHVEVDDREVTYRLTALHSRDRFGDRFELDETGELAACMAAMETVGDDRNLQDLAYCAWEDYWRERHEFGGAA